MNYSLRNQGKFQKSLKNVKESEKKIDIDLHQNVMGLSVTNTAAFH